MPILRQDLVQNGQERQVIKYIEILFFFCVADLFCHRLIGKLLLYPSNSVSHLRRSHRQTSYPPKQLVDESLILHGVCMVSLNESLFVASGSYDQLVSFSSISNIRKF